MNKIIDDLYLVEAGIILFIWMGAMLMSMIWYAFVVNMVGILW